MVPPSVICSTLPEVRSAVPPLSKAMLARSMVSPATKPEIVALGIAEPAICNWPPLPLYLIPPLTTAPLSRSSVAPEPLNLSLVGFCTACIIRRTIEARPGYNFLRVHNPVS